MLNGTKTLREIVNYYYQYLSVNGNIFTIDKNGNIIINGSTYGGGGGGGLTNPLTSNLDFNGNNLVGCGVGNFQSVIAISGSIQEGGFYDGNGNEFSDGSNVGAIDRGSYFSMSDGSLQVNGLITNSGGGTIFSSDYGAGAPDQGSYISLSDGSLFITGTQVCDGIIIGDILNGVAISLNGNGVVANGNTIINSSGNLNYGDGNNLTNGAHIVYPGNGDYLADNSTLFVPGGYQFASGGGLYDSSAHLFSDGTKLGSISGGMSIDLTVGNLVAYGQNVVDTVGRFYDALSGDPFYISGVGYVGPVISSDKGGAGSQAGILFADGSGNVSGTVAGVDYAVPAVVQSTTVASGSTITPDSFKDSTIYYHPSGTITALTLSLPSSSNIRVGNVVRFFTTQIITTLTINVTGSGTIVGTLPTAGTANMSIAFQCVSISGNGTWIRLY